MIWQLHSITAGSFWQGRMIPIAGRIGANGFLSSWASIARNSSALGFVSIMSPVWILIHRIPDIHAFTKLPGIGRILGVNINCAARYWLRDARHTLRTNECRRSGNDGSAERRSAHASVQVAGSSERLEPLGAVGDHLFERKRPPRP